MMPALSVFMYGIGGKPLYTFHELRRHRGLFDLYQTNPWGRPVAEILPRFL
jgi:hypothetical protein